MKHFREVQSGLCEWRLVIVVTLVVSACKHTFPCVLSPRVKTFFFFFYKNDRVDNGDDHATNELTDLFLSSLGHVALINWIIYFLIHSIFFHFRYNKSMECYRQLVSSIHIFTRVQFLMV